LLSKATVEDEAVLATGAYVAPLVAGLSAGVLGRDMLDYYVKLGRTFGIPLFGFAADYEGSKKTVDLLDAIAAHLPGVPPVSTAIGWSPEKVTLQNYSKFAPGLLKKFWNWWFEHGSKVQRVLLLKNLDEDNSLLRILQALKDKPDKTERDLAWIRAIEEYMKTVNLPEIGKSIFDGAMDPESPFLNPWTLGAYVMVQW